jgi:hypothetical protein
MPRFMSQPWLPGRSRPQGLTLGLSAIRSMIKRVRIPMSVYVFMAVVLAHWLLAVAACVVVLIWSRSRRRFWPCVVLSVLAFLGSYYGVTRIRITSSQTVNGHLRYYIDSRWFFMASLVFSILALAYTLWKRWRASHAA